MLILVSSSCNKDFLDKRQNSSLTIPSSLEDFQKILDADFYLKETPAFGELSSDDYYTANWKSITNLSEKNSYIWNKVIYDGTTAVQDWNLPYQQVFYANIVLDGLTKLPITNKNRLDWNTMRGSALFIRSYAFFNLSQIYSPIYDENAASNRLGIPLRLNGNVEEPTIRSTVKETYDQVINDLLMAKDILPNSISETSRNRPTKPAAFSLLARVYLSMREYGKAKNYSDSALSYHNILIDYNTISTTASFPFVLLNQETIYQSNLYTSSEILLNLRLAGGYFADSTLYKSYTSNDLRKSIFYSASTNVKGSYAERPRFSGLATDEVYLIRAECNARAGNAAEAMKDLNDLLKTRWKKLNGQTTFIDYTAINANDALQKILTERRKELVFRGLRWADLRRLNKEGANITLTRIVDGTTYTLPPNDPRYVAPIPNDVIAFSGIEQNPR